MQCPLICCTQKIVLYETQARYYVVGSNNTETRFRVLKIDRTEPRDLHVTDDKVDYSRKEIRDLLLTIDGGNRPRSKLPPTRGIAPAGLTRTVSAFGIVGFVRFLEGYYIILITKRRRVALIGQYTIYKVEDTSMVYLPKDVIRYNHPDEQKYVKMFQSVDLSSNFYFSYSYDLTRTFQYNMAPCQGLNQDQNSEPAKAKHKVWGSDVKMSQRVYDTPHTEENVEDASQTVNNFLDPTSRNSSEERDGGGAECGEREGAAETVLGVQTEPAWKFAWNLHMLRQVKDVLHSDWLLCVIHGFVGQSNVVVYGKPIYLTLVGRRSNQFAGTRFLKRGANEDGAVANEVETEQIVLDASVSALSRGRFTSYVQLRGSIPLHWSQDISKMVPKPPISLDMCDPYGFIAGQHFNHVLRRYGSPCIILNLVKQREKKPHESILSEELVNVIRYLNQFLSDQHALQYIGFDMARVSKSKNKNVLHRLEEIAEYCVKKTGFFQSSPDLHCNKLRRHPR